MAITFMGRPFRPGLKPPCKFVHRFDAWVHHLIPCPDCLKEGITHLIADLTKIDYRECRNCGWREFEGGAD